MLKLTKYLKPYLTGVFLALALLLVQALCDLNLPNYMADIVNVGLQQGGFEHSSPEVISPESFNSVLSYMSGEEKDLVQSRYIPGGSAQSAPPYYPELGESVYRRLPNLGESTVAELDAAFDSAAQKMGRNQTGVMLARQFYEELGIDIKVIQTKYILRVGAFMLLITLIGGIAAVLTGLIAPRVSAGAARDLRRDLFNKVEQFSHQEFDRFSASSLITRCTNDVTQVQMLVGMGLRMMCFAPIMGIGGIVMALRKSASMSWTIALAVGVLLCVIIVVVIVALPKFKIIQQLIDKLNLVSRETLSGLMVIRAFSAQKREQARFDAANAELTGTSLFVQRVMVTLMPVITLIMNGVTLLIIWVGANRIAESSLQVGDMLAFMQYAMQIIFSFMMIAMMFVFVPRAAVSGDRISEVLDTGLSITDPEAPREFIPSLKGTVEFRHVSFRYHNAEADALSDISFTAKPGEMTAIIGATGSGKSTVANLIMRFYDVTGGGVWVDGVDVREVSQTNLREKIGYVPQKGVLLSGTVSSNIKYGRSEADGEEVEKAARVAQALDFIGESPDGFEMKIAQGGTNVSGGQKQRLSIARALLKKPEILVLDDSFSALDFKTDAKLRKALREHTRETTLIVVAQRVGTIMGAEQIIVLDKGKIAGLGTHDELLKSCPAYYEIASSQLSEITGGTINE
ncbi:MAG: ABC transporter ATP-binding protein/permease [Clostridiales bacterium]|jgi:ATP-binding cassette subfamily B protein|nr:ABC transporter ATP-binding protein/permease [Clostridiales bacterium]